MYLSRVEINPYRHESIRVIDSPQMMHAAVMASFDSFSSPADGRVLWRLDKVGSVTYVLVQSEKKPDFHHIIDQFGRPESGYHWDTIDYGAFLSSICNGQEWRFRLRANPVHAVSEGSKRGKVFAHVSADQQMGWLNDRALKNGFSLRTENDMCTAGIVQRDVRRFIRDKKRVTVSTVTFEGILKVVDADILRESMVNGIGRAKAYGCGMLTLMRP